MGQRCARQGRSGQSAIAGESAVTSLFACRDEGRRSWSVRVRIRVGGLGRPVTGLGRDLAGGRRQIWFAVGWRSRKDLGGDVEIGQSGEELVNRSRRGRSVQLPFAKRVKMEKGK
ncbi:hypothetical protein RJT34_08758 [Clitoria ternatea]|uniref:Uncharacterized protein n=1 Tax=Clitoria ternatea TaxID=43366 RepID=A0AAN9K6S5_CLITE